MFINNNNLQNSYPKNLYCHSTKTIFPKMFTTYDRSYMLNNSLESELSKRVFSTIGAMGSKDIFNPLQDEEENVEKDVENVENEENTVNRIIVLPLDKKDFRYTLIANTEEKREDVNFINSITKKYEVNDILPTITQDMLDEQKNIKLDNFKEFVNNLSLNLMNYLMKKNIYRNAMNIYICADELLDYHNYIYDGSNRIWTGMSNQIVSNIFNNRGINVNIDVVSLSGYCILEQCVNNFNQRIYNYSIDETLPLDMSNFDCILLISGYNDLKQPQFLRNNLNSVFSTIIDNCNKLLSLDYVEYNDEVYWEPKHNDNIIIVKLNKDTNDMMLNQNNIYQKIDVIEKFFNKYIVNLLPNYNINHLEKIQNSVEIDIPLFQSILDELVTNLVQYLTNINIYKYKMNICICSDGILDTQTIYNNNKKDSTWYAINDYFNLKFIENNIFVHNISNYNLGYNTENEEYDFSNNLNNYKPPYDIDCVLILGGIFNIKKNYNEDIFFSSVQTTIFESLRMLNNQKFKISMGSKPYSAVYSMNDETQYKLVTKKNIMVFQVSDFRFAGHFSLNMQDRRRANIIDKLALDKGYLVHGIFPVYSNDKWTDKWHFCEKPFEEFVNLISYKIKKYLEKINKYSEGMNIYILSDSTLDYYNWASDNTRNNKADNYITTVFQKIGINVYLDTIADTGYLKATKMYARPTYGEMPGFAKRVENYLKDFENDIMVKFDYVIIIGGYNDCSADGLDDSDLIDAVTKTFDLCERLLK